MLSVEVRDHLVQTQARTVALKAPLPATESPEQLLYYSDVTGLLKARYSAPAVNHTHNSNNEYTSSMNTSSRGLFDWSAPGSVTLAITDAATCKTFSQKTACAVNAMLKIKVEAGTERGRAKEYMSPVSQRRLLRPTRVRVLDITLVGVHLVESGSLKLAGYAAGYSSPFTNLERVLPEISSAEEFEAARNLVLDMLEADVKRLNDDIEDSQTSVERLRTRISDVKCQFNVNIQFAPIQGFSPREIQDFEEDVEETFGAPTLWPLLPHLAGTISILSPDCNLLISPPHNETKCIKRQLYRRKAISYASLGWMSTIAELLSLLRQMSHTDTPSKRAKVSLTTLSIQIAMDAYLCFIHFVMAGSFGGELYPILTGLSFGKLLGFAVLGMRYLLDVARSRGADGGAAIGMVYSRSCEFDLLVAP
ncbi:hypothetical protein BC830DRAFT_476191 [Chytriomyces sp. MP71]|nr:hypothetical protein BC830DRAFT_476191 [Chytriomyces sp. MP71]